MAKTGTETSNSTGGLLAGLSSELASVVERVGPSIVRVDDGSRLTATGLLWSADGVIVTTSHGVEQDDNLVVELANGDRHAATLVGRDGDTDIAVLRVNASGLPAVQLAQDTEAKVGHLALALGRPGESGLQATIGIISARLESETNGQPGYILNTDAVLYPGFSGGALVNVNGQVLGLTNLMFGRGRGVALGAPIVQEVVNLLLTHGRVQRGYLGIRMQGVILPESVRKERNLAQEGGLLIIQVEPGSPAETGGLLLGDVLLSINDRLTDDVDELRSALRSLHAGQMVALRILRAGVVQDVKATLSAAE